ncbi:MAG: hypothetical protein ABJD11_18575 [Gemmatimonadota bacterium]
MRRAAALGILILAACRPETTRPVFAPVPDALTTELELPVPIATRRLADALVSESLTVSRVETRDGFLETPWLDASTGKPSSSRRLGPNMVRLRGWVDPSRPGYSDLTLETIFRPLADPSLPERELEHQLPADHPFAKRISAMMDTLTRKFGDPTALPPTAPKPDSTGAKTPGAGGKPPLKATGKTPVKINPKATPTPK